uniref:MRF_C2 domain-containing protein n=1 Tax=Heterorhabditis bacteriophora TaxID=37862 RepID=A0A1I7WGP8_HETBA
MDSIVMLREPSKVVRGVSIETFNIFIYLIMADDSFELSVGSYMQSAYRFRVGFTTESCFSNEDHMHGGLEEYNLIFYRTCAPPSSSTEVPTI